MSDDYRILIAIDLKTGTERLLVEATRYAKALNAIVDIIHVADLDPLVGYIKSSDPGEDQSLIDPGREPRAKALRTEHQQTQAFGATLRASGVRVGQALTVQGPVLEAILTHVGKLDSNVLMLGSHHHGALYRLWYGDTATAAAKQAPCALLVVPI
jgi:nucleotide-binding universal stress UspA family protein